MTPPSASRHLPSVAGGSADRNVPRCAHAASAIGSALAVVRRALAKASAALSRLAASGTIGGAYYDPAYDYSEFFAVTDGRNFQVVIAGAPFPDLPAAAVQRALLPVMQAAKPRPNLTFTYADPPELPRPNYRMVLVFDAANDLTAMSVCAGTIRHKPPLQAGRSTSSPSIAATISPCRRPPPGRTRPVRMTRKCRHCSPSSSSCCSTIRRAGASPSARSAAGSDGRPGFVARRMNLTPTFVQWECAFNE